MSPSKSITGVRIRTVRPSSSVRVTGVMSLVGQPCQFPVFSTFAASEPTAWSIRRKSGTALSAFAVAMLLMLPLAAQPRAEAHRVFAEKLSSGALGEARAIGGLLDAFRPGTVAVRAGGRA